MSEVLLYERPLEEEDLLELDAREQDSLKVELLYRKVGNEVLIHLSDEKEQNDLTFPVPTEKALDAFQHPYTYYGSYQSRQAA